MVGSVAAVAARLVAVAVEKDSVVAVVVDLAAAEEALEAAAASAEEAVVGWAENVATARSGAELVGHCLYRCGRCPYLVAEIGRDGRLSGEVAREGGEAGHGESAPGLISSTTAAARAPPLPEAAPRQHTAPNLGLWGATAKALSKK